jgi:hypothetical protein
MATPLPGIVQQAAAGLTGFDINTTVSAANAKIFKNAGYDFCIRYIPRTVALAAGNLTNAEAADIVNAGLSLMAVQHVALPGWAPTAALGTAYGSYAAEYCSQIVGLAKGINVWCDLEGVAPGTNSADVIAYCQAWYNAVNAAGYIPGIYVGYDTMLSPEQLYHSLSFRHYWRAYNGPQVAVRGFQLIQKPQVKVNGFYIDPNITQSDNLGGMPQWLSLPMASVKATIEV